MPWKKKETGKEEEKKWCLEVQTNLTLELAGQSTIAGCKLERILERKRIWHFPERRDCGENALHVISEKLVKKELDNKSISGGGPGGQYFLQLEARHQKEAEKKTSKRKLKDDIKKKPKKTTSKRKSCQQQHRILIN